MSVIQLSQKRFATALSLAEKGRYFDAAGLFLSTNDYESTINYIGCLCAMGEGLHAMNAMVDAYLKYNDKYNVLQDLQGLGDVAQKALFFLRKSMSDVNYGRDEAKLNADSARIANYRFVPDDGEELDLELDFYNDSVHWEEPCYNMAIYDTHSKLYRDHLRFRLEQAYVDQDDKAFEDYAKKLLNVTDADDLDTIEAQVMLCFYLQKPNKAAKLYDKLVAFGKEVSSRALRTVLAMLFERGAMRHADATKKFMELCIDKLDDFYCADLCDMIFYSTKMGRKDLAYVYAQKLFPMACDSYNCLDLLQVCASAFYNGKNAELAKQAALQIKSVVPGDRYSDAMLDLINSSMDVQCNLEMDIYGVEERVCHIPKSLQHFGVTCLIDRMKDNKKLSSIDLFRLNYVLANCKMPIDPNDKQIYDLMYFVLFALTEFNYDYNQLVEEFAKPVLLEPDMSPAIVGIVLQVIIAKGCRDKLVLVADCMHYELDLSVLTVTDDVFVRALSLSASFGKLDVGRVQSAYLDAKEKLPELVSQADDKQVAYLLCMTMNKDFRMGGYAETFSFEDRKLYRAYTEAKR